MSDRSARLLKHLSLIETGKRKVDKAADARLFLEAICSHQDPVRCIEKLVSNSNTFKAFQNSLRFDVSTDFLNGPAAEILEYLRNPGLEQLCNGQFLRKIILSMVDPPTFWNALVDSHNRKLLTEGAEIAFAWLLLQLVASSSCTDEITQVAKEAINDRSLLDSPFLDVRTYAYKLQNVLNVKSTNVSCFDEYKPGGRHDNDFEDFRKISILPTPDEISSTETPFYRKADAIYETEANLRPAMHYDNQFRLLREDFLAELRNDLQISQGKKKGRRTASDIHGLFLKGIDCGTETRRKPCSLTFFCRSGLSPISEMRPQDRSSYLKNNRNYLRHQSFGCLMQGSEVVAFASVERNEQLLAEDVPILVLQITDADALTRTLTKATSAEPFHFILVETAVFAYEPILQRLQGKTDFPLADSILSPEPVSQRLEVSDKLSLVIKQIREANGQNIGSILGTSKDISLDQSQFQSLMTSLEFSSSIIQGPPGTGKSFIGAVVAKVLHDFTNETILVICYTNHALDQFLEDLMDIGIPDESIVRLGAKSSERTKKLRLAVQTGGGNHTRRPWGYIYEQKDELKVLEQKLKENLTHFWRSITREELMEHLEFSDDEFYEAFRVPEQEDGMKRVGRGGKQIHKHYLLQRWMAGQDAGIFQHKTKENHADIWKMPRPKRHEIFDRWRFDILREDLEEIASLFKNYNRTEREIDDIFNQTNSTDVFKQKRIIACTTTAAAKYSQALEAAKPGTILVEEAGEILESHILTSMTRDTKQLVLIGDHKQLRPKVSNYNLMVEKGDGFDLNRSLFERLVLRQFPHTTLSKQHRMCPEISRLIRHLTYPDLLDAEKTQNRPALRGFQNKVIFMNHDQPELDLNGVTDRRDPTTKASKQNLFEVQMALKCVRYLGQQGYSSEKIVVLVPYLGQLHLLRKELSKTNDPVLNDLDSYDLVRAGLLSPASAQLQKRPILISTIDNYQGEERDIVIASLTRSNDRGDVGFMYAPERLNVLLSRARNALIVIGNFQTFLKSKKAKEAWQPLFDILTKSGNVYDGFPIKCEQHPSRMAIIRKPEDFDTECPDGGCSDPCTSKLRCGIHTCPQKCHQLYDHSKMDCINVVESTCPKKHRYRWKCYKGTPNSCPTCDDEARLEDEKKQRDFELELKRQENQREHAKKVAAVEQQIQGQIQAIKDMAEAKERQNVLVQKIQDLKELREKAELTAGKIDPQGQAPQSHPSSPLQSSQIPNSHTGTPPDKKTQVENSIEAKSNGDSQIQARESAARDEWERQKTVEGQSNKSLDSLMGMIGLEEVKEKFLSIKAKVDTVVRQNTSLKDERLSASLLGNPGTGKTTAARLYAKFLSSVGVLPGDFFVETSGSRLASDGIPGCKKHLEEILNSGGGALFIDEAYQLVSNPGGSQVLDFLLAEVENLTGKVVFVLAGYRKNMEAFFAHNPGIPSRFPIEFQFRDYEDAELQSILKHRMEQKYNGRMRLEGGIGGLYARIVSRRIGRGRGREGFGNARAVHNEFSRIADRQAKRLQRERRSGMRPDDMTLTKEDLLGPEPSAVLSGNSSWEKLQNLTGLESVKQAVQSLLDTIQYNYRRELEEKQVVEYSLNKVFVGNPGTGKTTVAKIYGQILADMGFLSNGEVVVKNPSDFVGDVLGASETTTKGILASALGKVLVIDEAYMLYGGSSSTGGQPISDPFKTAVIDTIVAEVQSVPGDDRCVLLLGYKDQMETMFQNVNPGLARRFPMDSAFHFEDYNDDDLQKILDLKLRQTGFDATSEAKNVVRERLRLARNKPHFGNAGEVDILLDRAKMEHQKRLSLRQTTSIDTFEALDFDPDFARAERGPTNCRQLFEGVVGCETLILQLEGYQRIVANMKKLGMDPREQIPFNFLFRGPPGTGKTSTARRMGQIFYDMGFLATVEVVECSATDLVGQYVGQTGPKTQKLLEKALGKVLFIDEAYRLAEGHFAKEAMDELVDCLTKPKFSKKLIVILAGYDQDINRLMATNPGLTSRFPETITFDHLLPDQCLELFQSCLKKEDKLDSTIVQPPSVTLKETLLGLFEKLSQLPAWGNARDVNTLAKSVINKVLASSTDAELRITEDMVLSAILQMVSEREHRKESTSFAKDPEIAMKQILQEDAPIPPTFNIASKAAPAQRQSPPPPPTPPPETPPPPPASLLSAVQESEQQALGRDPGVSDETWTQLQADKKAAEDEEKHYRELLDQDTKAKEELNDNIAAQLEAKRKADEENNNEARRLLEQERLRLERERRKYEEHLARIEQERKKKAEERRKEEAVQTKLRQMGLCPVGFRWIKQAGGYRCAGGTHWMSNAQLGI